MSVVADSLFTSIVVLFLMLAAVITTVAVAQWRMTKGLGAVMFGLYGVFVLQGTPPGGLTHVASP